MREVENFMTVVQEPRTNMTSVVMKTCKISEKANIEINFNLNAFVLKHLLWSLIPCL